MRKLDCSICMEYSFRTGQAEDDRYGVWEFDVNDNAYR